MSFTKITAGDLTNKGVRGLPDTPNLSTTDMQDKFEEVSIDVIVPKHNGLIDELEADTAAASIGAVDSNGDPTTVQNQLVAIQTGGYTKAEADAKFLAQTDAASTYLSQTDAASTYLSQADATSDYLSKVDAASTYLSQTDASSDYLSKADAATTYVAQVSGKDLSSNDYTDAEKSKLAGIEDNANNYVLPKGTQSTIGGVMGDGTTFTIDANGVGHAVGGGGGTSDYDALINHPKINGEELIGDKAASAFGIEAEDISYDNSVSGLTATDAQDAIDELAGRDAGDIDYDNTASGLTATDVQGAIDELSGYDAGDIGYDNTTSGLTATDVQSAIDEVDGSVDSLQSDVDDLQAGNGVTTLSVNLTGWTSDTTSQSGTTLYKKQISLNHVYVESPTVDIGSSGVLPTVAEQESYNLLQYVTVDDSVPCLYLYASAIPTTAFYINVTGVD